VLRDHDVETGELLVLVVGVDRGLLDQSVQFAVAQFRHGLQPTEVMRSEDAVPPSSRLTAGTRQQV
jgi:hypothetical protein